MKQNFIVSSITTVFSIPTASLFLLIIGVFTPVYSKPEKIEITGKTVSQDEVTLNVKATEKNRRPTLTLKQDDFTVIVDGQKIPTENITKWKSALDSQPKARLLFLLDFSGSMKGKDQRGTTKLEGAIKAIEAFIESAKKKGGDIKIAVLPFGEGTSSCETYTVSTETINEQGFHSPDDVALQEIINKLKNYKIADLCASTNLYEPLSNAIDYFADTTNTDFYPSLNPRLSEDDPRQPRKPQLSIILLSDGYHNKGNEAEEFDNLRSTLNSHPQITVHTLGYGRTPQELGTRIGKKQATRTDLYYGYGLPPKGKISAEEFVDRDRLAQIAKITNGIAGFSNNPQKIASSLTEFLNALGEYQITYKTPSAEEGKLYKVEVEVMEQGEIQKTKIPADYKISWNTLPLSQRLSIFVISLITLGLFGFLPWWLWGNRIKNQEQ